MAAPSSHAVSTRALFTSDMGALVRSLKVLMAVNWAVAAANALTCNRPKQQSSWERCTCLNRTSAAMRRAFNLLPWASFPWCPPNSIVMGGNAGRCNQCSLANSERQFTGLLARAEGASGALGAQGIITDEWSGRRQLHRRRSAFEPSRRGRLSRLEHNLGSIRILHRTARR